MYEYIDGNGNKYIIINEDKITIEYIPIKPHLSSSGIYEGGDYIKKEISTQDWNKLILLFNNVLKNKEIHIKNRIKMSGMIIIQEENMKKTFILRQNSKELLEIEVLLQAIIKL